MSGSERAALLEPPSEPESGSSSPNPTTPGSIEHNQSLATGVMWQGALRWMSQVLAWTATIVVARKLSPYDYGIAGSATVLVGVFSLLTDGGLARALVMRRDRDDRVVEGMHGASILTGIGIALVMLGIAYPLAQFYAEPRITAVVMALSIVMLLSGATAVPLGVMQQRLQYKQLAAIDFARASAQALTVLGCAVMGLGYWSLAIGLIVGYLVAFVGARYFVRLTPRRPTRAVVGPTIRYASQLGLSGIAWYLYANADFAVVGRVAGLTALGYYQFAWNVAQLPGEKLANVLQAVVSPFFASIGNDRVAMRHYFLILSELLVSVMFPILVGFALVSPIAVPILFGAKWIVSVPVMQVLVICAALSCVSLLSQHVLSATGQASVAAKLNLSALLILPVLFYIAARLAGPLAVAFVWLAAQPVLVTVPLLRLRSTIDLSLAQYLTELRAPAICTVLMAASVLVATPLLTSVAPIVQLTGLILLGAVVYVASMLLLFRQHVDAIAAVWRNR